MRKEQRTLLIGVTVFFTPVICALVFCILMYSYFPQEGKQPINCSEEARPAPTASFAPTTDTSLDSFCRANPKSPRCSEFCSRVDCKE